MDWEQTQRLGNKFQHDGKDFYDLLVGPKNRRAVVCGPGVLNPHYGFTWYYNPEAVCDGEPRQNAAKILTAQYPFSLIDHRSILLPLGKLGPKGDEIGYADQRGAVLDKILDNSTNLSCSNREYAAAVA